MENLSLCRGSVRGTWRGGFFSGDSEEHVREGFARGAAFSYRGCVKGVWREDSHTEDSERHVSEGSGKGAFLFYRGSIKGT
jgi:hypothetical protein